MATHWCRHCRATVFAEGDDRHVYRDDGLNGDYDNLDGEEQIMSLVEYGRARNPYDSCPTLESDRFLLRLVQESDAEDLLLCYSDPAAQRFFNADNCTSDFRYATAEETLRCIRTWLQEYEEHSYVRWSIIDRDTSRAIGTIEMFGDSTKPGVLRVDVASAYEKSDLLDELFSLANRHFYTLFRVERILTKAIPEAAERIAALTKNGFAPSEIPGRPHYYIVRTR